MSDEKKSPRSRSRGPEDAPKAEPRGLFGRAWAYLTTRVDPLTSIFLVLPLYLIYQLGTLALMHCENGQCAWVRNGADFITGTVMEATHGSRAAFAGVALAVGVGLGVGVLWARRRSKLRPRLFVPVLVESIVYASLVGPVVILVRGHLPLGAPGASSFAGDLVASCGAGLHEELIFRAVLFSGLAWLLVLVRLPSWVAVVVAGVVSSLVFSAVHHLGALGEPFTRDAFVFRTLAGLVFATVYRTRGFAIAAWTHCLYDVWIFAGQRLSGHG